MIRKLSAIILGGAMLLSLAACGSSENGVQELDPNDYAAGGAIYGNVLAKDAIVLKVNSNYFLEADANGEVKMVDLESVFGPAGENFSYINGNDGEVTLYMSKSYYADFEKSMSESVEKSFEEVIADETYFPYVDDVLWSEGFGEIIIHVNGEVYTETMSGMENPRDDAPGTVSAAALIYQQFTPEGITGCDVSVIDTTTGNSIGQFRFPSDNADGE